MSRSPSLAIGTHYEYPFGAWLPAPNGDRPGRTIIAAISR